MVFIPDSIKICRFVRKLLWDTDNVITSAYRYEIGVVQFFRRIPNFYMCPLQPFKELLVSHFRNIRPAEFSNESGLCNEDNYINVGNVIVRGCKWNKTVTKNVTVTKYVTLCDY
jgi:hypothetical protein